jgi:polysaccharide biosynthesis protein PslH
VRSGPVVVVVPLPPAGTGNGLAMRAGMLVDAMAAVADVHLVVVPVSGPADDCSWAAARARSVTVVDPITPANARDHTTRQLADPELRARLERTAPMPARAGLAPPTLASAVASALPKEARHPAALLAMRLYLAPLGVQLGRELGADRLVIDADDDDAALLRSLGDEDEADAYERLARCWLPDADAVLAASPIDAAGIATRAGIEHAVVAPNAVRIPAAVLPPPPVDDRLLFVGNLTYAPNRDAARLLACEILPPLRERRPRATLELVGPADPSLTDVAQGEGIDVTGAVPDVAPHYAHADVVVVPMRHGAGTRIKVLEAFAFRRPVVATATAIAGLDVTPGSHAAVVETPDEIAGAIDDLLGAPAQAAAMVERAAEVVATRYSPAAVAPVVQMAVLGTAARQPTGGSAAA